jgi:hypothetical protein
MLESGFLPSRKLLKLRECCYLPNSSLRSDVCSHQTVISFKNSGKQQEFQLAGEVSSPFFEANGPSFRQKWPFLWTQI